MSKNALIAEIRAAAWTVEELRIGLAELDVRDRGTDAVRYPVG